MELSTLLHTSLFRGLKEEDLVALLFGASSPVRRFRSGDLLVRQGDLCRGLYLLVSGRVRAGMVNDEGKELTVEELEAPAILASAFVFATDNRFPVQVEAISSCEVLLISRDRLLDFMHRYPQLLQNYLQDISDRSVFLSEKLNQFALQNLKVRILHYLKTHSTIHNQQEVALRLGVTRSSLARALAELAAEGKWQKEQSGDSGDVLA